VADILGSDEYYRRTGATPQGFVRTLYWDLAGREPTPQEVQQLGTVRPDQRREVAATLLQRFPGAWQGTGAAADAAEQDYQAGAQAAARALAQELQRLQEDIVGDLGGRKERDLYNQADAVLHDLRQFQRSLRFVRAGAERKHIGEQFNEMDRKLHALLEGLQAPGRNHPALLRAANRIQQADNQLHYVLYQGDATETRAREVLERQTQSLINVARQLHQTARYAQPAGPEGTRLDQNLGALIASAENFARILPKGAHKEVHGNFGPVAQAWARVVEDINRLPGGGRNHYLRTEAQQVDTVFDQLAARMGWKEDRTHVYVPPGYGR
jgi:hypothetical protein